MASWFCDLLDWVPRLAGLFGCAATAATSCLGYVEGDFVPVGPAVPGRVVLVEAGDTVLAGDRICILDPCQARADVLGSVAMVLAPVPMGIGTFEAACVATLSLTGSPIEPALTATPLFRGLSLWLPLLPGFLVSQREMRRARR